MTNTHTDDTDSFGKTVLACPHCDNASIETGSRGGMKARTSETGGRYRCRGCNETFDEPVERPPKRPNGLRGDSLAAQLDDMDADDLDADTDRRAGGPEP